MRKDVVVELCNAMFRKRAKERGVRGTMHKRTYRSIDYAVGRKKENDNLDLDVGCGCVRRAAVNLDINKDLPIDIMASGLYLPFKDKIFHKTYCYHVIEHMPNPHKLLDELVRVTSHVVEIRCPYKLSYTAKSDPTHIHVFNIRWYERYAKTKGLKCSGYTTFDTERPIMHRKFPFILPLETRIFIWSKKRRFT